MCQAKSEGGRRCPAHQYENMIEIRSAAFRSGLSYIQTEKLFNELRREAGRRHQAQPFRVAHYEHIRDSLVGTPIYKTVAGDVERVRRNDTHIDGSSMYAQAHLETRAKERAENLQKRFQEISDYTGFTLKDVSKKYDEVCKKTTFVDKILVSSKAFEAKRTAVKANLPHDHAAIRALMEIDNLVPIEGSRRVALIPSPYSGIIQAYGYAEGRLEVVFRRNPKRIYAYKNVPQDLWKGLTSSYRPASYYRKYIQDKSDYQYFSDKEDYNDTYRIRCAACGQFRVVSHVCPERAQLTKTGPDNITVELAQPEIPTPEINQQIGNLTPTVPFISFSLEAKRTESWSNKMKSRLVVPERLRTNNPNIMTSEEAIAFSDYQTTVNELVYLSVPSDLPRARSVLIGQNIEIGVEAKFAKGGIVSAQMTGEVEGSICYEKTSDPTNVVINSSNLQCFCIEYEKNAHCIHIDFMRDQHIALLLSSTNTSAPQAQSYDHFSSKHSQSLLEESEIRYLMQHNNVDRNEAREIKAAKEVKKKAIELSNQELRQENIQYREKMFQRWETVETPYSKNPQLFYEDYRTTLKRKTAKDEEPLPFRTQNVTDGVCADEPGTRSFGIELEFDINDEMDKPQALRKIGEELHKAGLIASPEQQEYHTASETGWSSWSFEKDQTVSGELVSPLMKDTPEHWEQLRQVTEIITRNGGTATSKTGSHVHVSTGSYEKSLAKHAELLRTVNQDEDLMYRLASNPQTNLHRKNEWCEPNANDEGDAFISIHIEESHNVLGNHGGHNTAISFGATSDDEQRKSHVEFRMWDGTLNPAVIQQQVMISVALTDYAERNTILNNGSAKPQPNTRSVTGSGRENEAKIVESAPPGTSPQQIFQNSNVRAAEFFDKLFRRREDRAAAAALFAITAWQKK
jgi:hypothetical protein